MTTPENKRDEEAIIEQLGNVTPTLKSDALKLCARIRADERKRIQAEIKNLNIYEDFDGDAVVRVEHLWAALGKKP